MIPWIVAGVSLLAAGCGARSGLELNEERNLPDDSVVAAGDGGVSGAGGAPMAACNASADKPERWWEGAWRHAGGVDKADSVSAFQLVGDQASLAIDGVPHPGSFVRLFGGKQEAVAQVVWNEFGPDVFRLRYLLSESNSRPAFRYIDPCTLSADYYIDGAGQAIFRKAHDIQDCPTK